MFNQVFFGCLWAASGFLGWRIKIKRFGGVVTTADVAMFVPSLIIGPINLLLAIIAIDALEAPTQRIEVDDGLRSALNRIIHPYADYDCTGMADGQIAGEITYGDLRAARAALSPTTIKGET